MISDYKDEANELYALSQRLRNEISEPLEFLSNEYREVALDEETYNSLKISLEETATSFVGHIFRFHLTHPYPGLFVNIWSEKIRYRPDISVYFYNNIDGDLNYDYAVQNYDRIADEYKYPKMMHKYIGSKDAIIRRYGLFGRHIYS